MTHFCSVESDLAKCSLGRSPDRCQTLVHKEESKKGSALLAAEAQFSCSSGYNFKDYLEHRERHLTRLIICLILSLTLEVLISKQALYIKSW